MTVDPLATMRPGEVGLGHGRADTPHAGLVEIRLPDERWHVSTTWHDALTIAIALQAHAQLAAIAAGVSQEVYLARLQESLGEVSAKLLGG